MELEGLRKKSAVLDDATVEDEKLAKAMALIDHLERELSDCKEAHGEEVHTIAMQSVLHVHAVAFAFVPFTSAENMTLVVHQIFHTSRDGCDIFLQSPETSLVVRLLCCPIIRVQIITTQL